MTCNTRLHACVHHHCTPLCAPNTARLCAHRTLHASVCTKHCTPLCAAALPMPQQRCIIRRAKECRKSKAHRCSQQWTSGEANIIPRPCIDYITPIHYITMPRKSIVYNHSLLMFVCKHNGKSLSGHHKDKLVLLFCLLYFNNNYLTLSNKNVLRQHNFTLLVEKLRIFEFRITAERKCVQFSTNK